MASEAEIERIRKDTKAWRSLAASLIAQDAVLHERHIVLLDGILSRNWLVELSYLQGEWLVDIKKELEIVSEYRGYSVKLLVRACYENRFGLEDDDIQAWFVDLFSRSSPIRRSEAGRIYFFAKQLGVIDH